MDGGGMAAADPIIESDMFKLNKKQGSKSFRDQKMKMRPVTQGQPRHNFISSQKALNSTIKSPKYIVKNNFCSSEGEFEKRVIKHESIKPSDASDLSMSPKPDAETTIKNMKSQMTGRQLLSLNRQSIKYMQRRLENKKSNCSIYSTRNSAREELKQRRASLTSPKTTEELIKKASITVE